MKTSFVPRSEYMAKNISHEEYFRQFVTYSILRTVEKQIGRKRILASKDPHLNDIPLDEWDQLSCATKAITWMFKEAGESNWTPSLNTCVLKQAARMLVE